MATLQVRDLHTHFGDVRAVDGVSLDVHDGEFLVLLGASGSGKSTLMRTIAGLEKTTSGEIRIGGRNVAGLAPNARNIAMVFQSYALYPHKSVRRNISFPLEAVRTDRATIDEKVDWVTRLFGIAHLKDRKPRALSGGERQRVALARALVREPNLFLLDEPLSNLDAKLRHLARHELKKLHETVGITTVYVTHDQVEAMGLGHRVAVMNHGRIEQIGTPGEIYRRPANTFVARFMGSPAMNLLRRDGTIVGFHPENLLPAAHFDPDPEAQRFAFRVTGEEDLGSDILLYGTIDQDEPRGGTGAVAPAAAGAGAGAPRAGAGDGAAGGGAAGRDAVGAVPSTAPSAGAGAPRAVPAAAGDEEADGAIIAKLPARLAGQVAVGREHEFFVRREFLNRFDARSGARLEEEAVAS